MKSRVDLTMAQRIVSDTVLVLKDLDGSMTDNTTSPSKAEIAQVNRELLNVADQLALAAALVRNEYWTGKGLLSYGI